MSHDMRITMMTMRSLLTGILLAATTPALAVDLCGDADGNGMITVTDGVQALRAAADLSSSCTLRRCDVDGSGSLSVTDGVNVLRSAAGLSVHLMCPGGEPTSPTPALTPTPTLTTCIAETVTVGLAVPKPIGAARLVLGYPENAVVLPGNGDSAAARVTILHPGALFGAGQPNDLDDRIIFSLVSIDGLAAGDLLTVHFDCLGAAPGAASFDCKLTDVFAPDGVTAITGATCSVAVAGE